MKLHRSLEGLRYWSRVPAIFSCVHMHVTKGMPLLSHASTHKKTWLAHETTQICALHKHMLNLYMSHSTCVGIFSVALRLNKAGSTSNLQAF